MYVCMYVCGACESYLKIPYSPSFGDDDVVQAGDSFASCGVSNESFFDAMAGWLAGRRGRLGLGAVLVSL